MKPDGRRLRGDRSRKRVLAFATTIASSDGIEGLTFGKVAAAAAVPKSTLQVLFQDREGLQLQTLQAGAESFAEGLRARLDPKMAHAERFRELCLAWFRLVRDLRMSGGCLVTAATAEYRVKSGKVGDAVEGYRNRWRDHLLFVARNAILAGELREDTDTEQLVFEILAFQAVANTSLADRSTSDFDRAERAVETCLARAAASGGHRDS